MPFLSYTKMCDTTYSHKNVWYYIAIPDVFIAYMSNCMGFWYDTIPIDTDSSSNNYKQCSSHSVLSHLASLSLQIITNNAPHIASVFSIAHRCKLCYVS